MQKNLKTDQELVSAIKKGGEARTRALRQIFSNERERRKIIGFLVQKGCSNEDAEDLFQDAFVIFDQNIRAGRFHWESNLYNYLFGIVKMIWLNKHRMLQRYRSTEKIPDAEIESYVLAYYEREAKNVLYRQLLNLLGKRCRTILTMYSEGYTTEEIGREADISDDVRLRKEKYRCLVRLRKKIQSNPTIMQLIKNEMRIN